MKDSYIDQQLAITFRYDASMVSTVKTLPERRWDSSKKTWWVPLEYLPQVLERLPTLTVSDRAIEAYKRLHPSIEASKATDTDKVGRQLPGGLMHPFQAAGVRYMEGKGGRVLLADEQGLGKTVQVLAYLARDQGDRMPALVVCPVVVKNHWQAEAEKWLGWDCEILEGRRPYRIRLAALTVINYDVFSDWLPVLVAQPFRTLIMDESHYLKNKKAKRTEAVELLSRSIPHIIGLTGTPVLNRPAEVYNQVRIIRPDLFTNWWQFHERYNGVKSTRWGVELGKPQNLPELEDRLRLNVMIRRTKEQVLPELPDLTRTTIPIGVDLTEFDTLKGRIIQRLDAARMDGTLSGLTLEEITQLRQVAVEAKIGPAISWLQNMKDSVESVVVFTHHHWVADQVAEALDAPVLDGRTSLAKRSELIKAFQAGEYPVIICGIRAMGVGINLHRASHCVFLELDWNMATHSQGEARLHRIGQKNAVTSYYVLALGTLDEAMLGMLYEKQDAMEGTVGDAPTPRVLELLMDSIIDKEEKK
jgi:SNF2 family DNA or RNA helicase